MKNKISLYFLRTVFNQYYNEEISLSKAAELINQKIAQYEQLEELSEMESYESWDDMWKNYVKALGGESSIYERQAFDWLKQHYSPPKRKV